MNYDGVGKLNVKAATDNGEDKGSIEVKIGDHFYVYEGGVYRQGKSVTWSGTFEKYAIDNPTQQIDALEGSGSISC